MTRRSSSPSRVTQLLIEAMVKHLPPSASVLRLVDVDGKSGAILLAQRPDLDVTPTASDTLGALPAEVFDAVVSFDTPLMGGFLAEALRLLRPGGRLITIDSERDPDENAVKTLEASGYTRILVEVGAECPLPVGMLARGEKPHTTDDTLARVRTATSRDSAARALTDYRGRFVHLLIQQTPNLPAWKLTPDTPIQWRVIAVTEESGDSMLLAFSSLPSAVAFMQEAVLKGRIRDVNKVAKFTVETARTWDHFVWLNPSSEALADRPVSLIDVDPSTAETPDE